MSSIYKTTQAKEALMQLYEEKLNSLNITYQELDVETSFGRTRIIQTGELLGPKIVLFHGINAGAPLTLEAVKELGDQYCIYAIDTIGQATKSAETVLDIKDDSYAIWADEVLAQLHIEQAHFIGISYGSFILQKLMIHRPQRVEKSIFVVPSGIVNGSVWPSIRHLSFPLMRFMITKADVHLRAFTKAFVPEGDDFMHRMQRELLLGVNIDFRRPTLLQAKDVVHFDKPVYVMVASDDIFFPGQKAIEKCKRIFNNLQAVYVLPDSKHMPAASSYPDIQSKLREWLA